MKKALVISCFFNKNNTSRPYLAYKYLSEKLETKIIYSEFSHTTKEYEIIEGDELIGVKAKRYNKNISINRVISHIDFSIKVKKIIKKEKPDLIYIAIPPNILGYVVVSVAKKMKIKTIIDIVDIWPEALPIPKYINKIMELTIGLVWKNLRSYCINKSDYIISESDYFKEKIKSNKYIDVIHLCKLQDIDNTLKNKIPYKRSNDLTIGYLGAMNNIYDFDSLIEICKRMKETRNIKLSIIGDGERRKWLLNELSKFNIEYEYFGKIFDEEQKRRILSKCDFGFNGYKDTTEVALSYKSIDYLSYGIPLINSAKGDTWNFIEKEKIGINYYKSDIDSIIYKLNQISRDEIISMKNNSLSIFINNFSWNKYTEKMEEVFISLSNKEINYEDISCNSRVQ